MKKGLSAVLLFVAVQILLFLIVRSALGMPLTQLLEQRLLSALVLGFGFLISKGVREAVNEKGLLGALTGGLTAAAGGTAAALCFGYLAALTFKSKPRG